MNGSLWTRQLKVNKKNCCQVAVVLFFSAGERKREADKNGDRITTFHFLQTSPSSPSLMERTIESWFDWGGGAPKCSIAVIFHFFPRRPFSFSLCSVKVNLECDPPADYTLNASCELERIFHFDFVFSAPSSVISLFAPRRDPVAAAAPAAPRDTTDSFSSEEFFLGGVSEDFHPQRCGGAVTNRASESPIRFRRLPGHRRRCSLSVGSRRAKEKNEHTSWPVAVG